MRMGILIGILLIFLVNDINVCSATCFCSVYGDPHVKTFNATAFDIGAGNHTLVRDVEGRFIVTISVLQWSKVVSHVKDVSVDLGNGGVMEVLESGKGKVYRGDGIEVKVSDTLNVYIALEENKAQSLDQNTLCGLCYIGDGKL